MSEDDEKQDNDDSQHPLVIVGIFAALGFEVGGAVFAGYYIGSLFDKRFDTTPSGMIVGMLVALVAVGIHFFAVASRIQKNQLS